MNQNILEIFNSNIIKWYPFIKDKSIIQIGLNEHITKELKRNFNNVKVIENIQELESNTKYNYVLVYGCENYNNIIEKIIDILDEDGKLLIIGNNETGINNWSKYNIENETGILRLENHHKKFNTINQIKSELKEKGILNINTFFAFPDYKTSELIINEKFKVEKGHIEKYNPNISENEIKVFDEIKVLKTIITNSPETMNFFANSYFIEASKKEEYNDIRYISFNNCRKEQYQLMTIIKDDVVEKIPANEEANKHIENMINIINDIKSEEIKVLDYEKDGKIYSKLIKNEKTLDRILSSNSNDIEKITQILNKLKEILLKNSIKYIDCKDKIEFKTDENILQELNYMKKGYWDMITKNCFYINDEFIFFDQEWEKDYLPVEFILYRSIINSYDLVRKIDVDKLLEKLNILQYKAFFDEIDEKLREEIIDKQIHEAMYKKDNLKAIDNLINDNKSYLKELENKDCYIKKLEKYVEDLKNDNSKKQEYIKILEENAAKKKRKLF